MKVLTATTRTQGTTPSDFTYTVPGELVYLGVVCDRDERDPDGPNACGCAKAFTGLSSSRATTTAEVREVELTADDFRQAVHASLERAGWLSLSKDPDGMVDGIAEEMTEIADEYPVGTVLGRRVDELHVREA